MRSRAGEGAAGSRERQTIETELSRVEVRGEEGQAGSPGFSAQTESRLWPPGLEHSPHQPDNTSLPAQRSPALSKSQAQLTVIYLRRAASDQVATATERIAGHVGSPVSRYPTGISRKLFRQVAERLPSMALSVLFPGGSAPHTPLMVKLD